MHVTSRRRRADKWRLTPCGHFNVRNIHKVSPTVQACPARNAWNSFSAWRVFKHPTLTHCMSAWFVSTGCLCCAFKSNRRRFCLLPSIPTRTDASYPTPPPRELQDNPVGRFVSPPAHFPLMRFVCFSFRWSLQGCLLDGPFYVLSRVGSRGRPHQADGISLSANGRSTGELIGRKKVQFRQPHLHCFGIRLHSSGAHLRYLPLVSYSS